MSGFDRTAVVSLLLGGALSAVVGLAATKAIWLWILVIGLTFAAAIIHTWPAAGRGSSLFRGLLAAGAITALLAVAWLSLDNKKSAELSQPSTEPSPPPPVPAPPPPPRPALMSTLTLREGRPLSFAKEGVTLSVSFSNDRLGQIATLQISAVGEPAIVEAALGPTGTIPFRTSARDHLLTIVGWSPDARTLDVMISPAVE